MEFLDWIILALLIGQALLLLVLVLRRAPSADDTAQALAPSLQQWQAEARSRSDELERHLRDEVGRSAALTRQELGQGLGQTLSLLQQTLLTQLGDATRTQNEQLDSFRVQLATLQQSLTDALRDSTHQFAQQATTLSEHQQVALTRLGDSQQQSFTRFNEVQLQAFARITEAQEAALRRLSDAMGEQLRLLSEANDRRMGEVRTTVETRLQALAQDNERKLEQMRLTVDEKLQTTLETRLGESFRQVAERLDQVHKGLGEMQRLASDVGSLNRVLTNVKTRGIFGEVQLAGLLEQVFTPEQYATNVETVPGTGARVEFAIRLPGRSADADGAPLWLPIDAKFPREDYERLLEAQDRADAPAVEVAAKAIEARLKLEARSIRDKYVSPPHTADFAILFVPTEGLYAEALRRPGLVEGLQREFRVMLAGPTTLLATLNSLQMGFRTLALEKRSSEVWQVLGAVKTEFGKFGDVLAKTRKKLDEASNTISQVETRTRVMGRTLKQVEALPEAGTQALLPAGEGDVPTGEDEAAEA